MNWLNYHHLQYFWTVVKEGGIGAACKVLHLTQPTVSKQIRQLEEQLGEPLFRRVSRRLELTEAGRMAFDYADEIFSLGHEFLESMQAVGQSRPRRLRVGISVVLPKLISHRILSHTLNAEEGNIHLICEEDRTERLLAELSIERLDLGFDGCAHRRIGQGQGVQSFPGRLWSEFFCGRRACETPKGAFSRQTRRRSISGADRFVAV